MKIIYRSEDPNTSTYNYVFIFIFYFFFENIIIYLYLLTEDIFHISQVLFQMIKNIIIAKHMFKLFSHTHILHSYCIVQHTYYRAWVLHSIIDPPTIDPPTIDPPLQVCNFTHKPRFPIPMEGIRRNGVGGTSISYFNSQAERASCTWGLGQVEPAAAASAPASLGWVRITCR